MIPSVRDVMSEKRVQYGIYAVIGIVVLGGLWFGYKQYQARNERNAFKEFSQASDAYLRITTLADAEDQLRDSDRAFFAGAEAHRSSVLYPYFLAFQADALIRLGKITDAARQLDKAIKAMDRQHPLYYLYALKAALVKIDTQDAELEKQGRAELDALSSDRANPLEDMALYYSALDASSRDEHERSQAQFKKIIAHNKRDSYWYLLADQKITSGS